MAEIAVVCLLGNADEEEVLRQLRGAGLGLVIRRRCLDAAELEACAHAGLGDVAVIDAAIAGPVGQGGPGGALLDRLAAAGLPAVVLTRPGQESAGACCVALTELALLARTVVAVASGAGADGAAARAVPVPPRAAAGGLLIAVCGAPGAPGRSTIALGLAGQLVHQGRAVLLCDADPTGGDIAAMLGVLEEAPGMLAVLRACQDAAPGPHALARLAPVAAGMRVLTGIEGPARAAELTTPHAGALWAAVRAFAEITVVDCGPALPPGQDWPADEAPWQGPAPLESAASRALAEADHVIAAGRADPAGLRHLIQVLGALNPEALPGRLTVVANRARPAAVGGRPGPIVRQVLRRAGVTAPVELLPDDAWAADRAMLRGRTLREVAPHAPLTRALDRLAGQLLASGPAHVPDKTKESPDDVAGLPALHAS